MNDYTHTNTGDSSAWWMVTLEKVYLISKIVVYNRNLNNERIDGIKVWVGANLPGGDYNGATNVATLKYVNGKQPYPIPDLDIEGSSVELQGGTCTCGGYVTLSEVEVYIMTIGMYNVSHKSEPY